MNWFHVINVQSSSVSTTNFMVETTKSKSQLNKTTNLDLGILDPPFLDSNHMLEFLNLSS